MPALAAAAAVVLAGGVALASHNMAPARPDGSATALPVGPPRSGSLTTDGAGRTAWTEAGAPLSPVQSEAKHRSETEADVEGLRDRAVSRLPLNRKAVEAPFVGPTLTTGYANLIYRTSSYRVAIPAADVVNALETNAFDQVKLVESVENTLPDETHVQVVRFRGVGARPIRPQPWPIP